MEVPYNGPEVMTLEEPQKQQQTQSVNSSEVKIPKEIPIELFDLFKKIVDSPNDINVLWEFTKKYLSYLESKTNLIKPFFDESEASGNLMNSIKKVSIENVPWGVYNCFLTITNLGSTIAQKEKLDDKDNYYIMYVMLSFGGNDSPVYQFTNLLNTLQTQDQNTQNIYQELNAKFIDAFKKYESPKETKDNSKNVSKDKSFFNKSFKIAGKNVSGNVILIVVVFVVLLLILVVSGFYYKKNMIKISTDSIGAPEQVGPLISNTVKQSFGNTNPSPPNSVISSIYSD